MKDGVCSVDDLSQRWALVAKNKFKFIRIESIRLTTMSDCIFLKSSMFWNTVQAKICDAKYEYVLLTSRLTDDLRLIDSQIDVLH